jgi:hypothetical protein
VFGPVITKVVKSIRNWQILLLIGQSFNVHSVGTVEVALTVVGVVQYVMFSDDDDPQVLIRNVQQTPNPSAHDPELAPPLSLHSALV